jgi:hypothetical protein
MRRFGLFSFAITVLIGLIALESAAMAQLSFGSVRSLDPKDPWHAAIAARADRDPVILFDPPVLDFGEIQAGKLVERTVRVINATSQPITLIKAIGSGSSFGARGTRTLNAGEYVEFTIGFKPGDKQNIDVHKRITFQIEGHPPVVYDLIGHTIEVIRIQPEWIDAPGPEDLLRQSRQGLTLDLGRLMPGNAYDVCVLVTNESEEPRTIASIASDVHDVPGWIDGPATLGAGETGLIHIPYLAPRFGRSLATVVEGWSVRFEDGVIEKLLLTANLAPPTALLFESDIIDLGTLQPGKSIIVPVNAVNVCGRPIRILKVIFSGSGVLPPWPMEPIAPLESVVIPCRISVPEAREQDLDLTRRFTVQLEDAPPQTFVIRGNVPAASGKGTTILP